MINKSIRTDNAPTTMLIRLMVGMVFLSEGIQKFLFPAIRGTGRLVKCVAQFNLHSELPISKSRPRFLRNPDN